MRRIVSSIPRSADCKATLERESRRLPVGKYPLERFRVIDFGTVIAGPLAARIFADMGAEVIKVETSSRLDALRMSADNFAKDPEKDPMYHTINRNKLCATVDLTNPQGRDLLRHLATVSDVVIENFSPRVMSGLGLDYNTLRRYRPDLVMISLSGAGQYGPLRDLPTYGPTVGALAGLDALAGYPGERALGTQGVYCDPSAAAHAAFAVLAALRHRNRTGRGQYIDLAQWETAISVTGEAIMEYTMTGRSPTALGNTHPRMAPHNTYKCKGDDKWIAVVAGSDDEWRRLCEAIGQPGMATDTRFADRFQRLHHQKELDAIIAAWTREREPYEAVEILQRAGVAASPVLDTGERFFDPQLQARGVHVEVEHPATGTDIIYGIPWKMSGTPTDIRTPAPLLGQHNGYVFGDVLGMGGDAVRQLVEQKVLT